MPYLNLKSNHKPVTDYYKTLRDVQQMSLLHEGAVAPAFANLLRACASRMNWTFAEQHQIPRKGRRPLRADGVFLDQLRLIKQVITVSIETVAIVNNLPPLEIIDESS